MERPASCSSALVGARRVASARASSARRTKVAEESLVKMFEHPPAPAVAGTRTNTVAMQTIMTVEDLCFFDAIVGLRSESGAITAAHVKDRHLLHYYLERHLLDWEEEETKQRSSLESSCIDCLVLVARLATSTMPPVRGSHVPPISIARSSPRNNTQERLLSHSFSNIVRSLPSPLSDSGRPCSASTMNVMDSLVLGPSDQHDLERHSTTGGDEVDQLKFKIQELEHKVRSGVRLGLLQGGVKTRSFVCRNPDRSAAMAFTPVSARCEQLCALEEEHRHDIVATESVYAESLFNEMKIFRLEQKLRMSARFLIHAPFTSYRPKIPLQHSLAGEEFLRRWILVETLQHYEDCLALLQTHENDMRNAIEDEWQGIHRGMYERVFFPHVRQRCELLEKDLVGITALAAEQQRKSDSLHASLKLRVIVDEEESLRKVLIKAAVDAFEGLELLSSEIGQLRQVHSTARRLEGELVRQKQRHQEEVAYLVSKIPRDGIIHPKWDQEQRHHCSNHSVPTSPSSGLKPTKPRTTPTRPSSAYWAGF